MEPPPETSQRWADLRPRIFSALLFAAVAFACLFYGGFWFALLVLTLALLMLREWQNLTAQQNKGLQRAGIFIIAIPCASMIWLRDLQLESSPHFGRDITLGLIFLLSSTDMGAYFVGKSYGLRKIWPAISPNKSWEGLLGGMLCAMLVTCLYGLLVNLPHLGMIVCVIAPLLTILAQVGDFGESWLKRKAGVKDTGNFLPGHGGLLDRLDSYLLTAPALAVMLTFLL